MKFLKLLFCGLYLLFINCNCYEKHGNEVLLSNEIHKNITYETSNIEIKKNNTITNPFIIQLQNTRLNDFNLFFISYSLFYLFMFSSLLFQKYFKISFFTKQIPYLNISRESFIFSVAYFIWWTSLLIYSFLSPKINDILFRTGLWISLNMGSVLIPITRNSIFLVLFNISYDHIIHIHKYIAILCFISVWIKLIVVIIYKGFSFLIIPINNTTTGGSPLMGTICSLSIILIFLLAMPFIRNKLFELFYYSHRILAFITIISGTFHYLMTLYYILPPFLLYIIDLVIREYHTHKAIYSYLKVVGSEKDNTSCVFIHITLLNPIKVNYGSYFFICFKDISRFQYHPLSLISEHNENLIFCAKDRGENTWTNKLKKYNISDGKSLLKNKHIYLQGPYGHVTINYEANKYKYLISVAGGIGITSVISVLQEINHLYVNNKLDKIEKIYLIWIASHYSLVKPFFSLLHKLENIFDINIYITRESFNNEDNQFKIIYEKPKISYVINNIIDTYKIVNNEMAIISCGPKILSNDLITLCSNLNIDISNENF